MKVKRSNAIRSALFVEGSTGITQSRLKDAFQEIWNNHICSAVGFKKFDLIEPISKKTLIAMNPATPVSGRDIPLDLRIAKALSEKQFDVAIIAWDLMPPWDASAKKCRWEETVRLYNGLRKSSVLPSPWQEKAEAKYRDLVQREFPSSRQLLQPFATGEIYAVCMDPMFETLLVLCEKSVRDILGFSHQSRGVVWPRWDKDSTNPDKMLDSAIRAARQIKATSDSLKSVKGSMDNAKNEWGEYLLKAMLKDQKCRSKIVAHPICQRLNELLVR